MNNLDVRNVFECRNKKKVRLMTYSTFFQILHIFEKMTSMSWVLVFGEISVIEEKQTKIFPVNSWKFLQSIHCFYYYSTTCYHANNKSFQFNFELKANDEARSWLCRFQVIVLWCFCQVYKKFFDYFWSPHSYMLSSFQIFNFGK